MKKQNRIGRKTDTAPHGAQSKAKRTASPARALLRSLRQPRGEELAFVELPHRRAQYLYREGAEFSLVTKGFEVRTGKAWVDWEVWEACHPDTTPTALPKGDVRRWSIARDLSRKEVVAWLYNNIGSVVIPAEFKADFAPDKPTVVQSSVEEPSLEAAVMSSCAWMFLVSEKLSTEIEELWETPKGNAIAAGISTICSDVRNQLTDAFKANHNRMRALRGFPPEPASAN